MPQGQNYEALAKRFGGTVETQPDYDAMAQQARLEPAPMPIDGNQIMRRFLGGAAQTLLPSTTPSDYIEGPKYALAHPLDSLKLLADAVIGAHSEQANKAMRAGREGRILESVGHGLAAAFPILGPAAANAGERIGSGDIAGGLGQAAGLLAPLGARKAAPVVEPGITAARTGLANAVEQAGVSRIRDATIPKVGPNKTRIANQITDDVAGRMMREPELGAYSRGGLLDKIETRLGEAEAALDAAADARLSARTFKTGPLIAELRAAQQKLTALAVEASDLAQRPTGPPTTQTAMGIPGRGQGGLAPVREYTASVSESRPIGGAPTTRTTMGIPGGGQPTTQQIRVPPRTAGEMNPAGDFRPSIGDAPRTSSVRGEGQPLGRDVVPPENRPAWDMYEQTIQELQQLGPVARYETLRRIRAARDISAKERYAPSIAQDYLKRQGSGIAAEHSAGVLRDFLAKVDPDTAAANADYAFFRKVRDVTRAAEESDRTRPNRGLRTVARASGAVAGGATGNAPGAIAGIIAGDTIERIATSGVTTKIQAARVLGQLADALRAGQADRIPSLRQQLAKLAATTTVKTSIHTGRVKIGDQDISIAR